jgi:ketosteroid isomerase-like protein
MSVVDQQTRNEVAARRCYEEMLNNRNPALVDELLNPKYEDHPLWHEPRTPARMEHKSVVEAMKEYLAKDDQDYEHLHTTVDQMISAGDKVIVVWTTTGTRNGKQVSWTGMEINRFVDGRIVESWWLWDRLGLYQQLGVVPETAELVKQAGLQL